jgi:hypothetical protein
VSDEKRYLVARFDVTEMTDEEIGHLAGNVEAQSDRNKDPDWYYPGCPVEVTMPDGWESKPRTVVLHLNITVPNDDSRATTAIADAVMGAIEVGKDDDAVRDLRIVDALAEEV